MCDDDDVFVVGGDNADTVLVVDKLVLHKHKSVNNINNRTSSLIENFKRCNKISDILPVVIMQGGGRVGFVGARFAAADGGDCYH